MAKPIKETPTLRGKDALVFEQKIKHPHTITNEEVLAARHSYDRIMSIAKFVF